MKFLVCIFLSFFCVFAQAQEFLSLDDLIDNMITGIGMDSRTVVKRLKAAEQGDTNAQLELAGVYFRAHYSKELGGKVSDELKQSFYWFEKAAKQGNPEAQTILGTIYCCSNSLDFRAKKGFFFKKPLVYKSYPTALEWFEKAADQGNSEAQHQIAVIKNTLKAREELRKNRWKQRKLEP